MSEKISNIILEIESKISALKAKLQSEVLKSEQLTLELSGLKTKNETLTSEITSLKSDLEQVQEENNLLVNKVNQTSTPNEVNKDVEIDFLVREIDQCISQIKNSL